VSWLGGCVALKVGDGGADARAVQSFAGSALTHVPYRGSQLIMSALLSGNIDCFVGDVSVPLEHIRAGTARRIAVITPASVPLLPDALALAELVPGFAATLWYGLHAAKATSSAAVRYPMRELARCLRERGADLSLTGPQSLAERLQAEVPQWLAVVTAGAIKAELHLRRRRAQLNTMPA
jgi:tripartite-type tricarboxylate transporter receptor subunit TctC